MTSSVCHLEFDITINISKRVRLLVEYFLSDARICYVPVVSIYETAALNDMIRHYCGERMVYDDVVRSDWNTMSVVIRLDPMAISGSLFGQSKLMFISIYNGESIFVKKTTAGNLIIGSLQVDTIGKFQYFLIFHAADERLIGVASHHLPFGAFRIYNLTVNKKMKSAESPLASSDTMASREKCQIAYPRMWTSDKSTSVMNDKLH